MANGFLFLNCLTVNIKVKGCGWVDGLSGVKSKIRILLFYLEILNTKLIR